MPLSRIEVLGKYNTVFPEGKDPDIDKHVQRIIKLTAEDAPEEHIGTERGILFDMIAIAVIENLSNGEST